MLSQPAKMVAGNTFRRLATQPPAGGASKLLPFPLRDTATCRSREAPLSFSSPQVSGGQAKRVACAQAMMDRATFWNPKQEDLLCNQTNGSGGRLAAKADPLA